ncbi:MAG: hypothetical protein GY720_18970 [bacterium]|nr:hypothetical protein [bacterium]
MLGSGGRHWTDAGTDIKLGLVALAVVAALLVVAAPAQALDVRYQEVPVAGWSVNGNVYSVHLHGDVVYVGGSFSRAVSPDGAVTRDRHNLAAFDRVTGELLPFRADTNGVVRGISADANTVWVGGHFTEIGGVARERVAALNATSGSVRSAFAAAVNSMVWDVEFAGSRVFIGGQFTTVDGDSHRRVAALDPITGEPDPGFSARSSGTVRSVVMSFANDTLYVGGSFKSIGGTSRDELVGLDPDTGSAKGVAFAEPGSLVHDVDVSDDGGTVFAAIGGTRNRAQAWSTSSGSRRWDRVAMGDVQAVSYEDGRLYFGFHEGYGNVTTVKLLAANAVTGSLDSSFRPRVNSFYGIWAIDASPGGLIAGGEFTRVTGVDTRGVAIFPRDGIPDLLPPSVPTGIYAYAASATSIEVAWQPSTDDVGISGYVVRRDGEIIATAPSAVFLDDGLDPNSSYDYTVEALDSVERSSGESGSATLKTWNHIVQAGVAWRYQQSGAVPAGWTSVGFDDSGWDQGGAQLGFGEGDEVTELDRGELAYYFRRTFVSPGGREVLDAALSLVRDDGAVVYLNGVEVFRTNMPAGAVGPDTAAVTTTGGSDESRWFDSDVPAELFRPGNNVLAVEVHQTNVNSSDVSFDLRLDGELSDEPFDEESPTMPGLVSAVAKSPTKVRLDWEPATDNRDVEGYRVFRNGREVGYTTGLKYVDKGLQPDRSYKYKVRAVDTSLNVGPASAVETVSTLPDVSAPSKPRKFTVVEATGTTMQLDWRASSDNVDVAHYIVRRDGVTIATPTKSKYLATGLEPNREYHFMVRAVDSSGNKSERKHLRSSTTPLIITSTLISAGDEWRYHDAGEDLGTQWRNRNYQDDSWDLGLGQFGYGDGDEATVVAGGPTNNRRITTYFRTEFFIGTPEEVPELLLRLLRDDGAVVYINGTEVFRSNMPGGSVTFETLASDGISGSDESSWISEFVATEGLRSGRNVIAVEIHQSGPRSSDVSFDAELVANP